MRGETQAPRRLEEGGVAVGLSLVIAGLFPPYLVLALSRSAIYRYSVGVTLAVRAPLRPPAFLFVYCVG